jgi:hypothetical protein
VHSSTWYLANAESVFRELEQERQRKLDAQLGSHDRRQVVHQLVVAHVAAVAENGE